MTGREPGSPASVWQEQPIEGHIPSPEEIRVRLARLDGRIYARNRIEYIVGGLVFLVFAVFTGRQIARHSFDLATLGAILLMFGVLTVGWQLHRRTGRVAAIDGARPSVETYRAELRRQRDALTSVWLWYIAPVVPGMVILYVAVLRSTGAGIWPIVGAVALAQITFMAWVVLINLRAARVLDAEIEAQTGRL